MGPILWRLQICSDNPRTLTTRGATTSTSETCPPELGIRFPSTRSLCPCFRQLRPGLWRSIGRPMRSNCAVAGFEGRWRVFQPPWFPHRRFCWFCPQVRFNSTRTSSRRLLCAFYMRHTHKNIYIYIYIYKYIINIYIYIHTHTHICNPRCI